MNTLQGKNMNYIYEYPKAFSKDFCEKIISKRKSLKIDPYADVPFWANDLGSKDIFEIQEELEETIITHAKYYFEQFSSLMDSSDISLFGYNVVRQALDHHDTLHYDTQMIHHKDDVKMRPFVCLLYLNDSFEGGQCVFPVQKKVITPEEGKLVIFPASYLFPHMVASICNDERYSIRITYSYKATMFEMDLDKWDSKYDTF